MFLIASSALAEVVRFEIVEIRPEFDGRSFGDVGPYQRIVARVYGEVDPESPLNAVIADIELAPRNENGLVEYATDVQIVLPVDLSKANDRILFEILNRGGQGILNRLNVGHGGNDGLLMNLGYVVAWAGWQSDYNVDRGGNGMLADIPIATNPDGSTITEQVLLSQIFNNTTGSNINLLFPTVDLEDPEAYILVRNASSGPLSELVEVPRDAWHFSNERQIVIDRSGSFFDAYDGGAEYTVFYTARDPDVSGLGYAITRDVVSFLRYSDSEENPLAGAINYVITHGNSQSGRMLKGFIYDGFNEDENGRLVFDGVNVNISGAHGMDLNRRFGDANATGRSYERHTTVKMQFPFRYEVSIDPLTGEEDGIFAVCSRNGSCPVVFHTDSGNESWGKNSMLVTTDGTGHDVELHPNLRVYYMAGTQHGPANNPGYGACQQLNNPLRWQTTLRPLILALDAWATSGIQPPASAYPRISDGTLAPTQPQYYFGWPEIPGVNFTGIHNTVGLLTEGLYPSRIEGEDYVVLVPRVDQDGNEVGGILAPQIQVPHGTYTGWALRREGLAFNEECTLQGQYIPFAATLEERLATGDPRLSLEERYGSHGEYVRLVAAAAADLVSEGYLLQQDADAIIEQAAAGIQQWGADLE